MRRKFTKYPSKLTASTKPHPKIPAGWERIPEGDDDDGNWGTIAKALPDNQGYYWINIIEDEQGRRCFELEVGYRGDDGSIGKIWKAASKPFYRLGDIVKYADTKWRQLQNEYDEDIDACDKVTAAIAAIHIGEFDLEHRESNVENDLRVTARDDGDWIYFLSDDDAIHMPSSCYDMNSYYTKLIKNKNYNGFKPKKLSYKSFENSVNKLVDSSDSLDDFEAKYRSFLCNLIGLQDIDACDNITASKYQPDICYRDRDNDDRVVALDVGMSDEDVEEMLAAHPSYYRSTLDRFDDIDACDEVMASSGIFYTDQGAGIGSRNQVLTEDDLIAAFNSLLAEGDPIANSYDSFEAWRDATLDSGLLSVEFLDEDVENPDVEFDDIESCDNVMASTHRYSAGRIEEDGTEDFYYDTGFDSYDEACDWGTNHDCTHIYDRDKDEFIPINSCDTKYFANMVNASTDDDYVKSSKYPDFEQKVAAKTFLDSVDPEKVKLVEDCRNALLSAYSAHYAVDEDGDDIDNPVGVHVSEIIRDYKSAAAEDWEDYTVEEADELFDDIMNALDDWHADDAAAWT